METKSYIGVDLGQPTFDIISFIEREMLDEYPISNTSCRIEKSIRTVGNKCNSNPGDNYIYEYVNLINDRVLVTIYIRRNDFNSNDILVSVFK